MFNREMKFTRPAGLLAGVLGATLVLHACAAELPPIFNGKDLAGWKVPDPNPFWKVVDGVLVGENDPEQKGSMLWTEQSYQDFVIECEARWRGEVDSGILFRQSADRKRQLQLQIGVSRSQKRDLTGSFYTGGKEKYPEAGQMKDVEKRLKPGQWNQFRLEARGDTFTVWFNGEPVVKYVDTNYPWAGPIGLQLHPGLPMKIEFRNLRAKALE